MSGTALMRMRERIGRESVLKEITVLMHRYGVTHEELEQYQLEHKTHDDYIRAKKTRPFEVKRNKEVTERGWRSKAETIGTDNEEASRPGVEPVRESTVEVPGEHRADREASHAEHQRAADAARGIGTERGSAAEFYEEAAGGAEEGGGDSESFISKYRTRRHRTES